MIARTLLDALLPPLCVTCHKPTSEAHGLCPDCWKDLHFITPPFCVACGLPFEFTIEGMADSMLCGECVRERPCFAEARAALSYNDASRSMILAFKHGDRTDLAPMLARIIAQAGEDILAKSDILIPVPLHPWRLFMRRYNQAALLAQQLGWMAGKLVTPALKRKRATPSQGHLTRDQRKANVKGAFQLPEKARAQVVGKNILLIDDVMTTGATADACAATLLKAGAAHVRILAVARVSRVEAV